MAGLDTWPSHLTLQYIERVSEEWMRRSPDDSSLRSCFQFVKYKMNVNRDMHIIADAGQRRAFCVALYEYSHRCVRLDAADDAFVTRYQTNNPR